MSQGASSLFEQYVKLSNNLHYDGMRGVASTTPASFADTIAAHLSVGATRSRTCSRSSRRSSGSEASPDLLEIEVDKLQVDRRITVSVKKQMEKAQKEYYLNEKMKAIQKELGRKDEQATRSTSCKKKIETVEDAEGRRGEGHPGAEAPGSDAADVGRSDRLAQLPRLAHRVPWTRRRARAAGPEARRGDPERGPLRAREDQGAHPRVPRRPRARQEAEGHDPLLRRPSGRRQDVARQVDRPRD